MKQYEAVIKVMESNGGFATLGQLYQDVLRVPGFEYKTKTPFESIRRIVQTMPEYFFKLKPGLWALRSMEDSIPKTMLPNAKVKQDERETSDHTYYQGLFAEIGKWKELRSFAPAQDRNRPFGKLRLGDVLSLDECPNFSYEKFTKVARTVDVVWFNDRNMPHAFCEVENSTDFQNSLVKFFELQDFHARFYIVAPEARRKQFDEKISREVFRALLQEQRVQFLNYDAIAAMHGSAAISASMSKL